MRIIANGPSIPDDLLLARDAGSVIFFCGAGVSRAKANWPDFSSLAKDVLDLLGSAMDSPSRRLFEAATAGIPGLICDANITEEIVRRSPLVLLDLLVVILDEDAAKWPYGTSQILQRLDEAEATRGDVRLAALARNELRRKG